ncbi:arylamine N-acetyltransferase [Amycolatopsis vancoresmycina]|uniref:N-acetyltransferase/amide synthase n=1 Tax=Amycolatopsis vancoresmycina DSM 44592 TaxID=1292037 RepID=R1HZ51_9PSEU|nr:arylamine N-acetyltransferase [Amycolatopsis vancoresmycina]EOD63519.1 N-acetyltransferase/amide synthase [Amycolatopsis vancoresmycina DSM 44592]
MFDVSTYLRRIGCAGVTGNDLETLRQLQKSHLMTIPYSSVAYGLRDATDVVDLDEDAVFETSIAQGKGGACYHLNRLFHRLLTELGYDVSPLAGSTTEGRETFGTDVEHMFNLVTLDGREWLVDVGYPGPTYLEPLPVGPGVQTQYSSQFRLVEKEAGYALQRRGAVTRWSVVYTFTTQPRQWSDWKELEDNFRALVGDTARTDLQEVLCGRAFENGQVFLRQRRYLTVRDGREQVRTITDDDEHRALIDRVLSGELG